MSNGSRLKRKSQLPKINRDLQNEFSESEDTENDFNSDNIVEKMDIPTDQVIIRRRGRPPKVNQRAKKIISSTSSEDSELNEDFKEIVDKPSAVLIEEQDVSGKSMFGFRKRRGKAQRISDIINNPPISKSEKTPSKKIAKEESTPYTLRNKTKQNVAMLLNDSNEDFSASESDFILSGPSSSESKNDSESEGHSDQSSKDETFKTPILPKQKSKNLTNTKARISKEQAYIMKSDDYFSWQANSKIITSNHTLQKLKQPKLSEDELQKLLKVCNLNQSAVHEKFIHDMFKSNCSNFNKWIYIIHEGFNILLYGLGSKRNFLQTFQKEMLNSSPVIVVNGYFPSLNIKDVTDSILVDIFDDTSAPSNVFEAFELIKDHCSRSKNINLYIIVHNIDGPMLRNNKSQNILALLAELPNVHLIASIDHINTPLIWDHSKLSKFNFTWWDVTSFLPYSDETSFESSMLVQRSGALALSSLSNVYQSLTKNSKGIFMLVVKFQLHNKSVKYYQGMPFKVLYSQCREHFLVSSDLALRTQLTEFLDHKLMKSKRAADGVEQLIIPINNSLLQQFLEQTS